MPALIVEDLAKSFTLHLQGSAVIPVLEHAHLSLEPGTCTVLSGASGHGKSTLLKLIYSSYRTASGRILIAHEGQMVDLVAAPPRRVLAVRKATLGYVSQFLRCVPRVPAVDVVAEPLVALGTAREHARERARTLLRRLNVKDRLIDLPPATFSGGEQQRVNIARAFIHRYPVLLDEPSASLDAENRAIVTDMILEAKAAGTAMLGIFHDPDVRERVADRIVPIGPMRAV